MASRAGEAVESRSVATPRRTGAAPVTGTSGQGGRGELRRRRPSRARRLRALAGRWYRCAEAPRRRRGVGPVRGAERDAGGATYPARNDGEELALVCIVCVAGSVVGSR